MTDYWSYILCESFYSTYFGEKYGFSNDTPLSILSSWLHFFFFKKPSTSLRAQSFLAQPGFEGSEFLSSLMNKLIFFSRNRPPVWGLKVSKLNLDLRAQNFLIVSWFATEEKSMPYIKIIFYTISLLEWLICFHDKKKLNLHVSSFLGPQHLSPQFLSGSEIWYPVSYKWASYKEKKRVLIHYGRATSTYVMAKISIGSISSLSPTSIIPFLETIPTSQSKRIFWTNFI